MNLTLDVRKGSRVPALCTGMTAIAAMMDSEAGGVDRAMLVDCLGAGGGPRETLVEKRQNISGEWMSVEKRTAAPTGPSSPLIVRTHTPLDRSDSVNPTPREDHSQNHAMMTWTVYASKRPFREPIFVYSDAHHELERGRMAKVSL